MRKSGKTFGNRAGWCFPIRLPGKRPGFRGLLLLVAFLVSAGADEPPEVADEAIEREWRREVEATPREMRDFLEAQGIDWESSLRRRVEQRLRGKEPERSEPDGAATPESGVADPVIVDPETVSPRFWTENLRPISLQVETETSYPDGFPETRMLFRASEKSFRMGEIRHFLLTDPGPGDSIRFLDSREPSNTIGLTLVPMGAILPALTERTLTGFVRGLGVEHRDAIEVLSDPPYLVRYANPVNNKAWGRLRYRIQEESVVHSLHFFDLDDHLLIARIRATEEDLPRLVSQVESAAIRLSIED